MFSDETFGATADSFSNPDFVDVVTHSYRHRFGLVEGDPRYAAIEQRLAQRPPIAAPTVILSGADDGVSSRRSDAAAIKGFIGPVSRLVLDGVGHNVPQEAPEAFAQAVLGLLAQ